MFFWKISSKSKPEEAPVEQGDSREKKHTIRITKWFKIPCQGEDRDRVKHHLFKLALRKRFEDTQDIVDASKDLR